MSYCDLNENPEIHLKILKEVTQALGETSELEELIAAILKLLKKKCWNETKHSFNCRSSIPRINDGSE